MSWNGLVFFFDLVYHPILQGKDLIIQADKIGESEQKIGGSFDFHYNATGNLDEVLPGKQEMERIQESGKLGDHHIVGVAERAVHIEADDLNAGNF